jgi:xylan 1,4-beta-xylosidase
MKGTMAKWSKGILLLMAGLVIQGAGVCEMHAQSEASGKRLIAADVTKVKGPRDMAWQFCVGSAHAGLMLSQGNQEQLAQVRREIGFRFVRFHGIFTDDMHVYSERDGMASYDWSKVDELYDKLLKLGIKPFVELSFMPKELANGTQEIFYWHALVTPPKDTSKWTALVEAFTRHLQSRYGDPQVRTWYFEVWNEPNYPGFWPNANQEAYFKLYSATAAAIKSVNSEYRVGGPATAGAGWVPEFIAYSAREKAPVDFISTHTYAVSSGFLDADRHADLVLSTAPDAISGDVKNVRQQILASKRPDLPLHITEWSASYSSRDPVHDSYTSAAFVLDKLKHAEGDAVSMSYWTYSDLFEENGPPPAAFHGGFGLLTRDDLPKAAYFSYRYLNLLGNTEIKNDDSASWVTRSGENVEVLLWNYTPLKQDEGDKAFYRKLHVPAPVVPADLRLRGLAVGKYMLKIYRTGYQRNDAYSAYLAMGTPKDLDATQLRELQRAVQNTPEYAAEVIMHSGGTFQRQIEMRENDVVLVSIEKE